MKKFEYKIVNLRTKGMVNIILTPEHEKRLNELGNDGWELISTSMTKDGRTVMCILKKEKND
jgi:hypothetical protein